MRRLRLLSVFMILLKSERVRKKEGMRERERRQSVFQVLDESKIAIMISFSLCLSPSLLLPVSLSLSLFRSFLRIRFVSFIHHDITLKKTKLNFSIL